MMLYRAEHGKVEKNISVQYRSEQRKTSCAEHLCTEQSRAVKSIYVQSRAEHNRAEQRKADKSTSSSPYPYPFFILSSRCSFQIAAYTHSLAFFFSPGFPESRC